MVVAGAAGTAVEVLGVAVVAVEGADALLELPLLKTVPSLFIYFPILFLRSAGPSDAPGAGELMLMVVVEAGLSWYVVLVAYSSAPKKRKSAPEKYCQKHIHKDWACRVSNALRLLC